MAIQIKNTRDVALNGVKLVIYGESGAGKTFLMGTAPRPIIISAEAGLLSLRKQDINYIEVHSLEELIEVYNFLLSEQGAQYETICLDSISEIAEIVLANEKKNAKDARQAYGTLVDVYLDLLRKFRDIPSKNVVFSAKMERVTLSDGTTKYSTMLPGTKTGPQTPYFFDEVFALRIFNNEQTGEPVRWLQTGADMQYVGKDRSGALAMFEPADLTYIINKIKGDVNA